MTRTTTAPMVASMIEPILPLASSTWRSGKTPLATSAPMMPITMLPISKNPAPRTISPASQPAIAPIINAARIPMSKPLKVPCKVPRLGHAEAILDEKARRSSAASGRKWRLWDRKREPGVRTALPPLDVHYMTGNLSSMFLQFFTSLRDAQVPVTLREYLTLMEALDADLAAPTEAHFSYLARVSLVKDERNLDKFDRVFGTVFKGLESLLDAMEKADIPEEWLKKLAEKYLTEEEKKQIEALGWDKLMETLRKRLEEQKGRHQGGNKWIGTAGTSPFGAHGYNPEGVRIGQEKNRNNRAVKVWDKREFKDLDGNVELGIRNIKIALRRLRKLASNGAPDELDLDSTIKETANHGYLDVIMRPERRNAVKVLVFFDIGGSMASHIAQVEELFSAAKSEFKHMEYFYFHNCLYEGVWKQNKRRFTDRTPTWDVLHKYPHDYKVVFVGDASMSPYEIMVPGGSVEHVNEEAGSVWLERIIRTYPHAVWLNPVAQKHWDYSESTTIIRRIFSQRMYPITIEGLENAMKELVR